MPGDFIFRHHVEPRVKLYSPREESFPVPLKYIDVSGTTHTHTNLDVKHGRRIDDYWNIDGLGDLSDYWTGFTQFILSQEKPPDEKIHRYALQDTRGKSDEINSKFACILEASESTRLRLEESLPKYREEKETTHCSITIWYTNLFLWLKQWRFPQHKQQWVRNGKNWRKSKVRNKWSMKQGRRALQFILHH